MDTRARSEVTHRQPRSLEIIHSLPKSPRMARAASNSRTMPTVMLTRQLTQNFGCDRNEIARKERAGALHRVRYGAYTTAAIDDVTERHRTLIWATVPLLAPGWIVSHESAAVLHGLPLPNSPLERVCVTRPVNDFGKVSGHLHAYCADTDLDDIVLVGGVSCTSVARTVADLARSGSFKWAVAAGDYALRNGLTTTDEFEHTLTSLYRRRGVRNARRSLRFADGRSESVGESLSRAVVHLGHLPAPELQVRFDDDEGLIGYADFFWREQGIIGEFDGRTKYESLVRAGETGADVLWREKQREDRLRALGHTIVRWHWDDVVSNSPRLVARLRTLLHR